VKRNNNNSADASLARQGYCRTLLVGPLAGRSQGFCRLWSQLSPITARRGVPPCRVKVVEPVMTDSGCLTGPVPGFISWLQLSVRGKASNDVDFVVLARSSLLAEDATATDDKETEFLKEAHNPLA